MGNAAQMMPLFRFSKREFGLHPTAWCRLWLRWSLTFSGLGLVSFAKPELRRRPIADEMMNLRDFVENCSVALYRLAFGQPRQDDLLALLDQVRDETAPEALAQLQISLRPD